MGRQGLRVPARNALLADLVPAAVYGRAYGFERAMDNLSAIGGPLLALALVSLVGVRTAIGVSVIPGLLAALAIVYAIRHAPRVTSRQRQPIRLRVQPVLAGRLGRLLLGVTCFEFGNVAATLLILRATELLTPAHGTTRATQLTLGLYTAYNLTATLASVPAGRLGDRRGALGVLAAGVTLFGAAYLGFGLAGAGVLWLAPWFVAAGIAIGCVETAEHAAVAALAPATLRGSAFGLLAGGAELREPGRQRRRRAAVDGRLADGGVRLSGRLDGRGVGRPAGSAHRPATLDGLTAQPHRLV